MTKGNHADTNSVLSSTSVSESSNRKTKDNISLNEKTYADSNSDKYYSTAKAQHDSEDSRLINRFLNSFKPAKEPTHEINNDLEDGTTSLMEETRLKKKMKSRHVIMMTLGTGIGTGLLVANASGLHTSGPASLVIAYFIVSFVAYFMIQAAGEMAVTYPTLPGNFNAYTSIFISKPFGFACVWLCCLQWLTILPLELITSSLTIKYWNDSINPDIFVLIFYVFLNFIHFFGVRAYGETEFIFNCCKILMIAGFIIFSIVVNCGGAGVDGYIGGKYWHDPGAFGSDTNIGRFKGICFILVTAYFSYGGTELFALSVAEQENPRKSTPAATKQSIYRIVVIYFLTMILIGFNVPHDSDQLMGAGGSATHASPYVLAASLHGVKVVPHIINAVILISVVSVANSALYAAPRLMCSLAKQGYAPRILGYVDRAGRPLSALLACSLFGVIGFASASSKEEEIFIWLAAIAGLSELFTWSGIMISHIRFRSAMKVQGRDSNEIGYKAITGVYGSYIGTFVNFLVFFAQFWIALAPPGGKISAESFFQSYLAFPIFFFFYFGYMIYNRDFTILTKLEDIDLDYHRRIYDPEFIKRENEENKLKLKHSSFLVRMTHFWC